MKLKYNRGKRVSYLARRHRITKRRESFFAGRRRYLRHKKGINSSKRTKNPIELIIMARNECRKRLYKKVKYKEKPIYVDIDGEFGLEHDFDNFLELSHSFLTFRAKALYFNLKECEKVWPSAVTTLCSLAQWVELTSFPDKLPKLASTTSNHDKVNSYLNHCGFYDYVDRSKEPVPRYYQKNEVVKIQRENKASNIEPREIEIVNLLKEYSAFDDEQIEEFDDVILTEIFNNVSEHGINKRDKGWWTISQHHKNAKIISICIADNGIGVKNNLITGPQREALTSRFPDDENNDGHYLKIAIEENVSGALKASVKSGLLIKRYDRGSRRGHGLKRVIASCGRLGISLSILSQKGYIAMNTDGTIKKFGTKDNKVFAGTLYHLTLPAKKEVAELKGRGM